MCRRHDALDGPARGSSDVDADPGADPDGNADHGDHPRTRESGSGETRRSTGGNAGHPGSGDAGGGASGSGDSGAGGSDRRNREPDPDRKFGSPTDQRTLSGDRATPETEYDRLPPMRVLGQFDDTYLVAETPSGLALVDQHAADERVNYERLRAAFEGGTTAQRLASPVELELTAGERATFEAAREALADLGFDAELLDRSEAGGTDERSDPGDRDGESVEEHRHVLSVRSVPAVLDETVDPGRLREVLSAFVDGDPGGTVSELADRFLADLACYPSITGNTSLTEGSVTDLLARLDDCENPFACPHGRPVVVRVDREEIADRFERDYPGHG